MFCREKHGVTKIITGKLVTGLQKCKRFGRPSPSPVLDSSWGGSGTCETLRVVLDSTGQAGRGRGRLGPLLRICHLPRVLCATPGWHGHVISPLQLPCEVVLTPSFYRKCRVTGEGSAGQVGARGRCSCLGLRLSPARPRGPQGARWPTSLTAGPAVAEPG